MYSGGTLRHVKIVHTCRLHLRNYSSKTIYVSRCRHLNAHNTVKFSSIMNYDVYSYFNNILIVDLKLSERLVLKRRVCMLFMLFSWINYVILFFASHLSFSSFFSSIASTIVKGEKKFSA